MKKLFLFLGFVLFAGVAFAVDVTPLPDGSLWAAVLDFATKLSGGNLTVFAVVLGLVQVCVVLFRTTIGANLAGKWTLVVLYGLNTLAAIVLGAMNGVGILEILGSGAVLSLLMNGVAELVKAIKPAVAA